MPQSIRSGIAPRAGRPNTLLATKSAGPSNAPGAAARGGPRRQPRHGPAAEVRLAEVRLAEVRHCAILPHPSLVRAKHGPHHGAAGNMAM